MSPVHVFWFRRDLRLDDNAALYHALKSGAQVLPVFIFDRTILDELEKPEDARVVFIHKVLEHLKGKLQKLGSDLLVLHDAPLHAFKKLTDTYSVAAVFTNHDYEPYAKERDTAVGNFLAERKIAFHTFKDQVIFEKEEVTKEDGNPFVVFTPYSKKWKQQCSDFYMRSYPVEKYQEHFIKQVSFDFPALESLGFAHAAVAFPPARVSEELLRNYLRDRDFPAINGTSRLSVHLRFGTISVRKLVTFAAAQSEKFLDELIWREFYMCLLWHFPYLVHQSFKSEYDRIPWRNDAHEFDCWCNGRTGIPLVDAGMRELNATGYMHNRVRMVVASFLTKNLLIDWRWGEAYFAQKLLDYELASNNGGWQWAAGCGVDAAPYFRVFNPITQQEKFDPQFAYIRKWVPEFGTVEYPAPIVDLKSSRERCLQVYKAALASGRNL